MSSFRTIINMIENGTEEERNAAEGIIKAILQEKGQAKAELYCAHGVIVEMQKEIDALKERLASAEV